MVDFMVERRVMAYSSFDYLLHPSITKLFAILPVLLTCESRKRKREQNSFLADGKVGNVDLVISLLQTYENR